MCTKLCKSCGKTKPVGDFHRDKNRLDGRYCTCKKCRSKRDDTVVAASPRKRGPKPTDERPAYEPNPLNVVATEWRMKRAGSVSRDGTFTFLRNGADLHPMVRVELEKVA